MEEPEDASGSGDGRLPWSQVRFLVLLGVPAMGLAFTVTVVSTYVPVLVEQVAGPVLVGVLVGGEGFFGLFMPALVGTFSDARSSRVRHRLRLLMACMAVIVLAVAAVGVVALLGASSLWSIAVALAVMYAGYYACLAPYWALYPDLVPRRQSGRSRSAESTWRVIGVGLALVGGGLLLDISTGLPFLVAAGMLLLVTAVLVLGLRDRYDVPVAGDASGHKYRAILALLADRQIRMLAIANALWNFALMGLRAFVVLFFTVGLDRSSTFVATVIFPLVAVGIAIAAPLSGWLADHVGHLRVLTLALVVYGVVMALPGFTHAAWALVVIVPVAMAAATVMTLPFSLLMRLLPEDNHGAGAGLFGMSRGVGGTLGPVVVGVAVVGLEPVLSATQGYAAMWFLCSAALLASLPFLLALRGDDRL